MCVKISDSGDTELTVPLDTGKEKPCMHLCLLSGLMKVIKKCMKEA